VSLRSALERLPADRATQAAVREILTFFRRHEGEPVSSARVSQVTDLHTSSVEDMLAILRKSFVLDSCGDPPRYVYRTDRLLELEIDRFMRRAETHSGRLQSNVEKFRSRYGQQ